MSLVIKPPLDSTSAAASTPSQHQNVKLSTEQENIIKEVFHLLNTRSEGLDEIESDREDEVQSKSGLDESEFASAIKALGFSSRNHKKMAKDLMAKVDTDGNNSVSLEEFTNLMEGQLTGRDPDEEINAIFAAFVNYAENDRITGQRLEEVAKHFGVNLTEHELESMFCNMAQREHGIDKKEFVQILKHSTWI